MKIEGGNLEDFSPKFAVKLQAVYKVLNFNALRNRCKIDDFVKIFYQFLSMLIPRVGTYFMDVRKTTGNSFHNEAGGHT